MQNPKTNFIYNFIYQLLILIIPLIISPYISRVIGASGMGIYSYTYSVVYYFMILTSLGVNNYGNRTIAKVRDDKEKLSKAFCEIYSMQLIMGLIMLILYILYNSIFNIEYKTISIIQGIYILSTMIDINWFYFGLEEFKKTISRNIIVKIGTVILIFVFVKAETDLWKYTIIMSGMTFLSQFVLWNYIIKKIIFIKPNFKSIKEHIKPNLILFIPIVAVSLYKMMDKVMLGILSNVTEVGLYENAEKIINVPMTFIMTLGTVMLPRITNIISKGNVDQANEYLDKSIKFIMFISAAMCFGLFGVGYNFAPFFFGEEFQKTGILIMLLSFTLLFLSFANVIRTQYLIPNEKDDIFINSVVIGAIINIVSNTLFIPKYQSVGACIGTILAEASVMIYQSYKVRKKVPIKKYLKESIFFIIKAIIMLFVISIFNYFDLNELLRITIQILFGILVYYLLNLRYANSLLKELKVK